MSIRRLIIWAAALLMLLTGLAASAQEGKLTRLARTVDREQNVQEAPSVMEESFLLPSVSTWRPYTSGGEKHVEIVSSGEWYVKSCPEWVEMYILREKSGSYQGKVTWELHPLDIDAEDGAQEVYPDGAELFLWVDENGSGEDRDGTIILSLLGGTEARIRVIQTKHVEELSVEIVKPCADALDTVPAGQKIRVEIQTSNAVKGRVQITDLEDRVLYSQLFTGETHAFEFVFEAGCYVITAEASGDEYIGFAQDGYVRDQAVVTAYELEYIEEIGVTRQYVEYIKIREGKRNMPYQDSAGNWTIGYGHLISAEAAEVYRKKGGWTDEQCEQQLMEDLKLHADLMKQRLPEEIYEQLTPNQFDALMSLEFNACGRAVSEKYRLGRCIRNLDTVKDYEVINGFITWHGILDGEYDVLGLYYRRMEEARIFLYADYTTKWNWPVPWWLNVGAGGKGRSIHEVPSGDGWLRDVMPQLETSTTLIQPESGAASEYVTIQSSSAWNISIDEEYSWISASSYRGSDGSVVQIRVQENTGSEARHGKVKVTCGAVTRTIHVHQAGNE